MTLTKTETTICGGGGLAYSEGRFAFAPRIFQRDSPLGESDDSPITRIRITRRSSSSRGFSAPAARRVIRERGRSHAPRDVTPRLRLFALDA